MAQEDEGESRWKAVFPAAQWLPEYQPRWLKSDVVAGITLAAYAIPVSLAYAGLAGLPPQDAEWLNRTLATWKSETDTLPSLAYEQLDVMKMELPPGWRGYGAKDHIDHPDTARRLAEIEALKQQRDGADRFALQKTLMPYEHLLPEHFRGRNERIDERL